MEANKEFINNLYIDDPKMSDAFKQEYEGQKIKDNINFKKFKTSILKKYGQKAKIFYCKKDKIYFYYNDSNYPYKGFCPICKKNICYFCSEIDWDESCCLKKRIYYLLTIEALIFFDTYPKHRNKVFKFNNFLLFALIPYLNSIFFFSGLHVYIYKLKTKIKIDGNYKMVNKYLNFEQYIKGVNNHWEIFELIILLDFITIIVLSIPLIFLIYIFYYFININFNTF